MSFELEALAPAKVNLHLEVLYRRPDGYHEIETIFQALDLRDRLRLRSTKGPIHVRCDHPQVPTDRSNLCHRAAKLLKTHHGVRGGVDIELEKHVPVAAGLGGGSSDAAATLVALNRLWELGLEWEELHEHAVKLGADVPFFLRGGTAVGRGIGDDLTPVHASGRGVYLLVTLPIAISSAWAYEHLRMGLTHSTPKVNLQTTKALLSRFPDRQWPGFNRLGDVVLPAYPELHRLHLDLLDTQPKLAMLSGSGPTIFAVYSDSEEAQRARDRVAPREAFTWIGSSTRQGIVLREI